MKINIFKNHENVQGFNFQPGFAALVEGDKILAATSGWETGGGKYLYVYRPQNGGWIGSWEDEETFPVEDVLDVSELAGQRTVV